MMEGPESRAPLGEPTEVPNSLQNPNPRNCFTVLFIHDFVLLGTVRQVQRYPDCTACAESGKPCVPTGDPAICGCDTCDKCVVAAIEDELEKDQLRADFDLEARVPGAVTAYKCAIIQRVYQCGHNKGLPFFVRCRTCPVCEGLAWPNLCTPDRGSEWEHISEVRGRCFRCRYTMAPPPLPPRSPSPPVEGPASPPRWRYRRRAG